MPTSEDMDRVIAQIETLTEDRAFTRLDETQIAPVSHGRGTDDGVFFWDELDESYKRVALAASVDWTGFTEGEKADVIQRVIEGEDAKFWMEGVKNYNPENDFAMPLTKMQQENNLADIAASNGLTTQEVDDYYHRMESRTDEGDTANRPIRPLTEQLITATLLDIWPGNAAIIDFGIDSDRHLGALQYAIRYGEVSPEELDAAMGSGAMLTEIAQRGDNPYRDVVFETSWDRMRIEPPDDPSVKDDNGLFAEVRADEFAARVRDYGEADAATYDQRVRDGASTIRHPEPVAPEEIEKALTKVERSWPVGKETPALTGKAALERLLFGGKAPEVKQPEKTKDKGIEI